MFTRAIVITPCKALVDGITSANLGIPNYQKALIQHTDYIMALKECGLEVTILPADEKFPDSTFVEDVALLTAHCAIITHPGASSRTDEVKSIRPLISDFFDEIESIKTPGTVEGGGDMMVANHYYIGLSERTNKAGADQMITILNKYDLTGSVINLANALHLKTGVCYLENNNLLACGEFLNKTEFQKYHLLVVNNDEAYAANSEWINGIVLTPKGFPTTKRMIF